MKTIGVIGGGNMGSAIISGIRKDFVIHLCEKDFDRVKDLKQRFGLKTDDLPIVIEASDILILAVKPQDFDDVLEEIRPLLTNQSIISIAAGITTTYIEKRLKSTPRVIRSMPNLPAQVGQALTALCKGKWATAKDLELASQIFKKVGKVIEVEEKWMDAVTAVSGSGPAYVFIFIECFIKAAQSLGFTEKQSKELVMQTIKGSVGLLGSQNEDAASLRARVTSKGGTTQAAMDVLMAADLDGIFKKALMAARNRARELAK